MRRLLQIVTLVGTLIVGIVAVTLIVSQTPWFRDWLRRYVVRESKQYLNGELTIGKLGGNLLFGVNLADVAVDVSGERVVAVKTVEVDYNFIDFISRGIILDEIKVVQPQLRVERNGEGWNLNGLIKARAQEADRKGPGRPISLRAIEIEDGSLVVTDNGGDSAYDIPERIEDLDVRAAFHYQPVRYSVDIEHLSFNGASPRLDLEQLRGNITVRDDNLYLENVVLRTGASSLTVAGVVEDYLRTPVLRVSTSGKVSLPEIGRVARAASGYSLNPQFDIKASGPANRLALDLDVRSEAGAVKGRLTTDVAAPEFAVEGQVRLEALNLAPLLKDPAQQSHITGDALVDIRLADARAPVIDRLAGRFEFKGPRVEAAGYTAADVQASGTFQEGRILLDARALAYGGTATASGYVRPPAEGRSLEFALDGRADGVRLKNLPASTKAPALETDLSVARYHVEGRGATISGAATLNRSSVEGATVNNGTEVDFRTGPDGVSYAARGAVADLNLRRIGEALKIRALAKASYESRIAAEFSVKGSGTTLESMTLDAEGTLTDSTLMGATFSTLAFESHLRDGALAASAKGAFADLNPGQIAEQPRLDGRVSGQLDARVDIADLAAPVTLDAVTASGTISLRRSEVGGLQIDTAEMQAKYASRVADVTTLQLTGPNLEMTASGTIALDRSSASNLQYSVEATDLAELGRVAGQDGLSGSATLKGVVTGNAASLETTGTVDGSKLGYQENTALDLRSQYTVTIPDLQASMARVQATTTAELLKAGAVEINELTAKTTYTEKRLEFTTTVTAQMREIDATGSVIFHPDHQEIHLPQLALRTEGLEWRTLPETDAAVQYGAGRITIDNLRLVSGDQSLEVNGNVALEAEQPTGKLDVFAKNVDLSQLERLLLLDRGLSGRLSANATIAGTMDAPRVDGHVEVADGGFRNYRYQSLVADVDYAENRIGLDATLQQSPTERITAKGSVPRSLFQASEGGHVEAGAGDRVDVQIQSTALSLGFVQGFTTAVTNVTGTFEADVRLTGSAADPHLQGHVDIRNGAFGVPAVGVSYTGLDTRIALDPDVVRIQAFKLLDEEGAPLAVSGELAVHAREVGAVDVNIDAKNFEVIDNELGDVGVDSQLKVTGELRRPQIVGTVRVAAGRLEVDRILALTYDPYEVTAIPAVVSAERVTAGSGNAEAAARNVEERVDPVAARQAAGQTDVEVQGLAEAGALSPVALDVRLRIPNNLVLRGNDLRPGGPTAAAIGNLNVTVGGDLRVTKEPGGPVILAGTVNTVRGTYEFQGRRFQLARDGIVRFTGDRDINPILDVTALREIPNTGVEARIHITGTMREPSFELSSTPPLEESDVLALILFNRPVNELGTGERASLAATAGSVATGFLAAPLGESIGRALDLDLFEITTTSEGGELGAGITVGQQIGDRAFLRLRQQFGERSITEFLVEYQLADFLRLQASGAPETSGSANRVGQRRIERAGIDLIFFFSY